MSISKFFQMNRLVPLVLLFTMIGYLGGCRGTTPPPKPVEYKGAGFQATLPAPGTRVVVWGNHAAAVDRASLWFHQHDFVMIDRTRLEQGLKSQSSRLGGGSRNWYKILEAGNRIGAELVTFVEVTSIQDGRNFALSDVDKSEDYRISVEVRSIEARTGEVISKGRASQTIDGEEPDDIVEGLTQQALQWAWAEREDTKTTPKPAKKIEGNNLGAASPQDSVKGRSDQLEAGALFFVKPVSQTNPDFLGRLPTSSSGTSETLASREITSPTDRLSIQGGESHTTEDVRGQPTPAGPSEEPGIGLQLGSGALTLVYFPVKLIYAGLGGLVAGTAYIVGAGNEEVVDAIWVASVGGTYFISPAHLQGDKPVYFRGIPKKDRQEHEELVDSIIVQSAVPPPNDRE